MKSIKGQIDVWRFLRLRRFRGSYVSDGWKLDTLKRLRLEVRGREKGTRSHLA
jgi:hypothetical protein